MRINSIGYNPYGGKRVLRNIGLATLMTVGLASCNQNVSKDDYMKYTPAYPSVKPLLNRSNVTVDENLIVRVGVDPFVIINGERLSNEEISTLET